jgi:transposase
MVVWVSVGCWRLSFVQYPGLCNETRASPTRRNHSTTHSINPENCTITMPKDPRTGRRREATIEEKVDVIAKKKEGKTFREIEKETGVSRAEAQRIYTKWEKNKTLSNEPRPGRPQKLSQRDLRLVKRLCRKKPTATLEDLTVESGLEVKADTLARKLRDERWYARRMRRKTWLDPTVLRKRYRWCLLRKK